MITTLLPTPSPDSGYLWPLINLTDVSGESFISRKAVHKECVCVCVYTNQIGYSFELTDLFMMKKI